MKNLPQTPWPRILKGTNINKIFEMNYTFFCKEWPIRDCTKWSKENIGHNFFAFFKVPSLKQRGGTFHICTKYTYVTYSSLLSLLMTSPFFLDYPIPKIMTPPNLVLLRDFHLLLMYSLSLDTELKEYHCTLL